MIPKCQSFPILVAPKKNEIGDAKRSDSAAILIGPHQVEKPTLLDQLVMVEKSMILTCEDDDHVKTLTDSKNYLKSMHQYDAVVIHQAQYVPGIGRTVNLMINSTNRGL